MDWEELRNEWQTRDGAAAAQELARPEEVRRLWKRVGWRDALETGIALLLVPCFAFMGYWLAQDGLWLAAAFSAMLVVVLLYIPWRLRRIRRLIPTPDPRQPVHDFLVAERAALAAQARLVRSVARWYYGPIAVGVIGFYTSIQGLSLSSLVYAGFVLALCAAIEAGNRAAAAKGFEPAIDELDKQIRQLEDESND